MKKLILVLTLLVSTACLCANAESIECLKYKGLCFTYPTPAYKLLPPLKTVGNGGAMQFQKSDTFFNISKKHCEQMGFRLPKKDEAALVFEYLQWVPFTEKHMYFWLDENTNSALAPILDYNPLISPVIGQVRDVYKHREQYICAMCVKEIEQK